MLPNKVVSIKNSILWKLPDTIKAVKESNNIMDVYNVLDNQFDDVNDFILCIDILYVLDIIKTIDEKGYYIYVKED